MSNNAIRRKCNEKYLFVAVCRGENVILLYFCKKINSATVVIFVRVETQKTRQQQNHNPTSNMSGEEQDLDYSYPLPDYAMIDASGYEVNDKSCIQPRSHGEILTEADDPDFVVVPDECFGYGWLDKRVGTLLDGVDLVKKKFYRAVPRCFDKAPQDVPLDHPLRAIAAVLNESPPGSNIRVKCDMLTDWFAIDLLLHYGASHVVQIIVDYAPPAEVADAIRLDKEKKPHHKYTAHTLRKFLDFFQRANSVLFFETVEIRVAKTVDGHCCKYGRSSMQEKTVITENHTACGSYNLTGYARCKNWESLYVFDTTQDVLEGFDTHWAALGEDREITKVYPDIFPDVQQQVAHKKRRAA